MSTTAELRPAAVPLNEGTSTSFTGNDNFHRSLCDLIDGAEREIVDIVIPETRPDEHDQFILKAYGNAARRGIATRTLIAPAHLALVQGTWDPDFDMRTFLGKVPQIRLIEKVHGPFTVVDRERVMLNIPDAVNASEYTTSLVVQDPALAEHLIATFDQLWADAAPQQEALIAGWEAEQP